MRTSAAALLLLLHTWPAQAWDYPRGIALPDSDVALGLSGGVGSVEPWGRRTTGPHTSLDLSWLDGLWGLHASLSGQREGQSWRAGATLEATYWYVLLVGIGVGHGRMVDEGGPGIADRTSRLSILLGAPFVVARLGASEASGAGALALAPWVRPWVRLAGAQGREARGGMHAGLSLRWTSYRF